MSQSAIVTSGRSLLSNRRAHLTGQGQTTLEGDELEAKTIAKIRVVRERVRYVLEHYPSTKGNDRELMFRYYRIFEPWTGFRVRDFDALLSMTNPETIRRRRQELNAKGEYLPRDGKRAKRKRISEIPQVKI
jgi:hypothetical protein